MQSKEKLFDVFLSHNWGKDTQDRDNHARVRNLKEKLAGRGLKVWFDEDNFDGANINREMCGGIDSSKVLF